MDELVGLCVFQTTEIACRKKWDSEDRVRVSLSPTLARTFSIDLDYFGEYVYEVSAPELGPFGHVYLSEQDFKQQAAEICIFEAPLSCKFYNKDKHFRLSSHRGGKARAVRPGFFMPDDNETEEEESQ